MRGTVEVTVRASVTVAVIVTDEVVSAINDNDDEVKWQCFR